MVDTKKTDTVKYSPPLCPYRKLIKCLDKNEHEVSFNDDNVFMRVEYFKECLGDFCARYDLLNHNCKGM